MFDGRSRPSVSGPHMVRCAADYEIAHRSARCDVVTLRQDADRKLTAVGDPPFVWRQRPCEYPQQRGLSRSVAAHDTNRLAATQTEADAVEQRTRGVADGDAFGVDQIAHRLIKRCTRALESLHLPEGRRSRADMCQAGNESELSAIVREARTMGTDLDQRPRIAWRTPFT